MKYLFLMFILVGCATKPLTKRNVKDLAPEDVAAKGSEADIFTKAELLIKANDVNGFIKLAQTVPNIDSQNNIGDTLLHISVAAQDVRTIKEVIKRQPNLNLLNKFNYTPLMTAIVSGTRESARALLQAGADSTIPDAFDMNCLMRAAYHEDLAMIKLLIQYKATPFSAKPGREKASTLAKWSEVRKMLLDYEASFAR